MANPSKQLFAAIYLAIIVAPLILVGGCSPEGGLNSAGLAPSSESVSQQGFAARPASVADIIAQLEAERPDPTRAARYRELAEMQIPAELSGTRLVEFLIRRSDAKQFLGQASGELDDARRAVFEARRLQPGNEHILLRALDRLTMAENITGSTHSALALALETIEIFEKNPTNFSLTMRVYRRAVQYASLLRDKEKADLLMNKLERYYRASPPRITFSRFFLTFIYSLPAPSIKSISARWKQQNVPGAKL